MTALIIIGVVLALIGIWVWSIYNGLVKANVRVDEAWSDITVQLKRRYDLIPNLVKTVKGYAKQEKDVLENVTKARNMAVQATGSPEEQAKAENAFASTLKSLFAVSEAYPDLKSDKNFQALQDELVDTENKIQASRRFYNGSARDLNIKIKVFPTNLIARNLGFTEREFFEVEEAAVQEPVDVSFE